MKVTPPLFSGLGWTDSGRGRLATAAGWCAAVLVVVLAALYGVAAVVLDPAFVSERVSRTLGPGIGPGSVEVGGVRLLPHRFGASVTSLRIESGPRPEDRARTAAEGPGGWALSVPRLTVTGVSLPSLFGGSLSAARARAVAPRLTRSSRATGLRGGPEGAAVPRRPREGDHEVRPPISVEQVVISEATLDLAVLGLPWPLAGVANGVDLELRNVVLEPASGTPGRPLSSVARAHVPSYRSRGPEGRSHLRLEGLHLDPPSGRGSAGRVQFRAVGPAVPAATLRELGIAARDTTRIRAAGVEIRGLAVDTAVSRPRVLAQSLHLDTLSVLVSNGATPDAAPERRPPRTPVQHLRDLLAVGGRIDTVSFRNGRVRYRKRRLDRSRSGGTLTFEGVEGSVRPLPFGPSPPSSRPEAVRVAVDGRVGGSGPLRVRARFPDRPDVYSFRVSGGVADLHLPTLNSMFRPVEGLHIRGGHLDSLRFRMRVENGFAEGEVVPVYDQLDLSVEDPSAGGTGLDEHLRTFLMGLRLNARNQPADGDDFRTGDIRHRASPEEGFPSFLWRALLGGLRDVAGV